MWDFKYADLELYREAIHQCNSDECFNEKNIDVAIEMRFNKVVKVAKSIIPNRTMTIKPNDKPWYNNMLGRLCRRKNRLHSLAKQWNTAESHARFG